MQASIYVYPEFQSKAALDNFVSRVAWYYSPYLSRIKTINIACADPAWLRSVQLAPHLDPLIADRIPSVLDKITFLTAESLTLEIERAAPKIDIVLIADETAEVGLLPQVKAQFDKFARHGGRYRVDHERTRQEGSFYLWSGLNKLSDARALTLEYEARFRTMAAEISMNEKAYVFGTGPSFSDFIDGHDFSDGISIVANSIVKNDAALDILRPKLICASDPIYHAGCSSYAAEFRKSLVSALEKTGAWFVCPLRDASIYRAFLPSSLEKRMVCIPFDADKPIQTDISKNFYTNPFPNILTLALLPLAATFARSIHIVGCDGRRLLDDSFFWSHDKKVQFNDQMADIQAAHPGFFAIDYNDYFLDHCLDVERTLNALEETGHDIVTETPSLIPALAHRERRSNITASVPKLDTLVMIDPDAKDEWGHFLAYDKRLATAACKNQINLALLCRKDLADHYKPTDATSMHPIFSVNSWTIGNQSSPKRENILRFARELSLGLKEVANIYQDGDIAVLFYVGSLEAAEMLEFILFDHPRVNAIVNLFWSYNFDHNDLAYAQRWRAVALRMHAHPRLHLMHSTRQIADEFQRDWNLNLPVLEHPSTTFSDEDALLLAKAPITPPHAEDRPLRVVFPGGARAEKGFLLSCQSVNQLRNDAQLTIAFRARLDKVSGAALHRAFADLDTDGIEVIDEDLSDDEFIDMIRSADIVVIPYHSDAFRRRTSGILIDAMLLGKPVVVLEKTWLADIVNAEKIGVSAPATPEGLAEGIRQIARNPACFTESIEAARRSYVETNSWNALVRSVFGVAGDLRFVPNASSNTPTHQSEERQPVRAVSAIQANTPDAPAFASLGRDGMLIQLSSQLLLDAAKAIKRLRSDAPLKAMVTAAVATADTDTRLAGHLKRCLAFAKIDLKELR
jgi:glycosyltransferase involved in cell wall biosynthesis